MHIDFQDLFSKHGIRYTTRQHSQGNIGINCPFCARTTDPDPSEHMGVDIKTGAWNCWRNSKHRGKKPHRLLNALLGMSYADVDNMLGVVAAPTSEFDAVFAKGKNPFAVDAEPQSRNSLSNIALDSLATFAPITHSVSQPHLDYLRRRGIAEQVAREFGLLAGIIGRWAGRVIFPVFTPDSAQVVSWTARSIGAAVPKYIALGREHGANLKHLLYNAARLSAGGKTIVVTEGPMDAIALQQLAPESAVTCTFGLTVSNIQIALLKMANFSRVVFLFDSTAYGNAVDCAHRAGGDAVDFSTLFNRAGDPAELTTHDIPRLREAGIQ